MEAQERSSAGEDLLQLLQAFAPLCSRCFSTCFRTGRSSDLGPRGDFQPEEISRGLQDQPRPPKLGGRRQEVRRLCFLWWKQLSVVSIAENLPSCWDTNTHSLTNTNTHTLAHKLKHTHTHTHSHTQTHTPSHTHLLTHTHTHRLLAVIGQVQWLRPACRHHVSHGNPN